LTLRYLKFTIYCTLNIYIRHFICFLKDKKVFLIKIFLIIFKCFRQIHLELCKTSKIVCTVFGIQITWEIGEIIMILIGALYNLYVRFIIQQYKIKSWANQTTFVLAMCFLCILKVVPLSRICKYAAVEVIYLVYHFVRARVYVCVCLWL